jgi:hypothetical protein
VEQFPGKHGTAENSACQQTKAHNNIPDDTSLNASNELDLIFTYLDGMRIIPCPEVTIMDA